MASLNKVMIIGNLGKDPEVRKTPGGQNVASFSLACTEKYNDRNGQRQEKTEWVNVVVWGRQAEIAEQYLKKGMPVYVEGRLQTTSWDDAQSGQKRYKTEVVGSNFLMLGSKGGNGGPSNDMPPADAYDQYASQPSYASQSSSQASSIPDDDLPF
jgi:single-strand DNA-binding protein